MTDHILHLPEIFSDDSPIDVHDPAPVHLESATWQQLPRDLFPNVMYFLTAPYLLLLRIVDTRMRDMVHSHLHARFRMIIIPFCRYPRAPSTSVALCEDLMRFMTTTKSAVSGSRGLEAMSPGEWSISPTVLQIHVPRTAALEWMSFINGRTTFEAITMQHVNTREHRRIYGNNASTIIKYASPEVVPQWFIVIVVSKTELTPTTIFDQATTALHGFWTPTYVFHAYPLFFLTQEKNGVSYTDKRMLLNTRALYSIDDGHLEQLVSDISDLQARGYTLVAYPSAEATEDTCRCIVYCYHAHRRTVDSSMLSAVFRPLSAQGITFYKWTWGDGISFCLGGDACASEHSTVPVRGFVSEAAGMHRVWSVE